MLRNSDHRPRAQQSGYVLLMVLVAILMLIAAATVLVLQAQNRMNVVRDQYRNVYLMSLLDSGLATAAARIRTDPFYEGNESVQLGDGRVRVQVTPSATLGVRLVTLEAVYRGESRRGHSQIFAEIGQLPQIYGLQVLSGSFVAGSDDS